MSQPTNEVFAPRPTGKEPENVELTGKLLPWGSEEQPVLLQMPACEDFFLPLFSTEDKLRELLGWANVAFDRIKRVDDGPEFLGSLPYVYEGASLRIIIDPRFTPEGRIRFDEILRRPSE